MAPRESLRRAAKRAAVAERSDGATESDSSEGSESSSESDDNESYAPNAAASAAAGRLKRHRASKSEKDDATDKDEGEGEEEEEDSSSSSSSSDDGAPAAKGPGTACAHCGKRVTVAACAKAGQRAPLAGARLWRCFTCEDGDGIDKLVVRDGDWLLVKWNGTAAWLSSWARADRCKRLSKAKLRNFEKRCADEDLEYEVDADDENGAATAHKDATEPDADVLMDGSGEAAEAPSPADLNHLRIIDRFPVLGCIRIQRVFAQKSAKRGRHLLVKWEGLSYDEATWELERDVLLFAQPGTVEAFEERAAKGVATAETVAFGVVAAATKNKPLDTQPPWMVGGNLHGYQLDGINWLRAKASARTHVILADEMGLGKTVQSAGLIAANSAEAFAPKSDKAAWKPALVIAPLSTLANWERELSNWCPWLHVVVLSGTAAARDLTKLHELSTESAANKTKGRRWVAHVVVTSYEMATAERAFLARRTWSSMIVDEGHRLKSGTRGILFRDLSRIPAAHKVLLTGTPLQNAIEELHHLLHFLDEPGQGSRAKKPVDDSAFDAQTDDGESDGEEDALKLVELRHLLEGRMLRRLKADVLAKSALPPKKELVVRVELSKLQKHVYRSLLTKNYASLVDNTAQKKISKPKSLQNVVMQLRKACNHAVLLDEIAPEELSDDEGEAEDRRKKRLQRLLDGSGKLALLDRMLDKLKDRGHRVLIFSQMTRMLDVLEDYLSLKDFGFARFDGSTAARSRQALIDEFNSKGSNTFVFLLSTRAGGLGINLATADTVVIFDQDWNPHNDLQALARAHRIGQQQTVLVYRLVCRASVEERILHVAKKKLCLEALTIQSQAHKPLSRSELDDVLRYGAEELFAEAEDVEVPLPPGSDDKARQKHVDEVQGRARKYGDGGLQSNVITYDDAAVDALLDRSGPDEEDEEAPEVQKGALGKLMESFKTADSQFATPAAPAEAVAGAPPQKGAAMAAGAATAAAAMAAEKAADSPAARFDWAALLQDSYKSDQVMDFDKHGFGKRARKPPEALGARKRALDSDDESNDDEIDEDFVAPPNEPESSDSDDMDDDEVGRPDKVARLANGASPQRVAQPDNPQVNPQVAAQKALAQRAATQRALLEAEDKKLEMLARTVAQKLMNHGLLFAPGASNAAEAGGGGDAWWLQLHDLYALPARVRPDQTKAIVQRLLMHAIDAGPAAPKPRAAAALAAGAAAAGAAAAAQPGGALAPPMLPSVAPFIADSVARSVFASADAQAPPFCAERMLQRIAFFSLAETQIRLAETQIRQRALDKSNAMTADSTALVSADASPALDAPAPSWTPDHDRRMLVAVACLGYGRWDRVSQTLDLLPAIAFQLDKGRTSTPVPAAVSASPLGEAASAAGSSVAVAPGLKKNAASNYVRERCRALEGAFIADLKRQPQTAPPVETGALRDPGQLLQRALVWQKAANQRIHRGTGAFGVAAMAFQDAGQAAAFKLYASGSKMFEGQAACEMARIAAHKAVVAASDVFPIMLSSLKPHALHLATAAKSCQGGLTLAKRLLFAADTALAQQLQAEKTFRAACEAYARPPRTTGPPLIDARAAAEAGARLAAEARSLLEARAFNEAERNAAERNAAVAQRNAAAEVASRAAVASKMALEASELKEAEARSQAFMQLKAAAEAKSRATAMAAVDARAKAAAEQKAAATLKAATAKEAKRVADAKAKADALHAKAKAKADADAKFVAETRAAVDARASVEAKAVAAKAAEAAASAAAAAAAKATAVPAVTQATASPAAKVTAVPAVTAAPTTPAPAKVTAVPTAAWAAAGVAARPKAPAATGWRGGAATAIAPKPAAVAPKPAAAAVTGWRGGAPTAPAVAAAPAAAAVTAAAKAAPAVAKAAPAVAKATPAASPVAAAPASAWVAAGVPARPKAPAAAAKPAATGWRGGAPAPVAVTAAPPLAAVAPTTPAVTASATKRPAADSPTAPSSATKRPRSAVASPRPAGAQVFDLTDEPSDPKPVDPKPVFDLT